MIVFKKEYRCFFIFLKFYIELTLLNNLKKTIESLATLIDEKSPFNITPSILESAGFTSTALHNFMQIPDSFKTFIYKCNAHQSTDLSALDEDYLGVVFDLYIAPIFT